MDSAVGKVLGASERTSYFLENLKFKSSPLFFVDILIVTVLFYAVYLFLKETRAMRILYGLLFLAGLFVVGNLLNLTLLNWILKNLMTMLIVAIPVVFQPELRGVLERMGRSKFFSEKVFSHHGSGGTVEEVVTAAKQLSERRIGGLIVLQRQTGLREYIENGVQIDANVSSAMLLSIFFPRSPLHDGAVIIASDRIITARSTLPVSEANLNPDLGMRHKSGLGITENSDAVSVIISEETGTISLAAGGKLERRISEERLRNRLTALMRYS